VQRFA